jgi:hypothetical protein
MKSIFKILFLCLLGFLGLMWLVGSQTNQNNT